LQVLRIDEDFRRRAVERGREKTVEQGGQRQQRDGAENPEPAAHQDALQIAQFDSGSRV